MTQSAPRSRDHGGGIDAARAQYGGARGDWLDLSTGINPCPYPVKKIPLESCTCLPDQGASDRLISAARRFWNVPAAAQILPAPGASSVIARLPGLFPKGTVCIPAPTYNEHAAAFENHGWTITQSGPANAQVLVHPNNPDGRLWTTADLTAQVKIIDESFADICPEHSLIHESTRPNTLILKSFGKFWGLAGLRLGFAIGDPELIDRLRDMLGPWPVSGPALSIGTTALADHAWASQTRDRLTNDALRLDALLAPHAGLIGGTSLFRLYQTPNAAALHERLAQHHIWTRSFPYAPDWLRLGLPGSPTDWTKLETAL
jgi:cobalamin biosynthetic protein CobC